MYVRGMPSLLIALVVFAFFTPLYAGAVTCPEGQVEITPETRAIATSAKIPLSSLCWKPNIAAAGMNAGQAKQYLESVPSRSISNCAVPKDRISGLNDTFAICAAQFLKAFSEQHGQVTITTAYRPPRDNQCRGGADNSNHTRGVAMDVNPPNESLYPAMWKFASNNPQFGICFPFQDGKTSLGYYDRPHMVLAGISGSRESGECARQGVTKACSGLSFVPNRTSTSPGSTITAAITDRFREALGLETQQPYGGEAQQQPYAGQIAQPTQPAFSSQTAPGQSPLQGMAGGQSGGSIPAGGSGGTSGGASFDDFPQPTGVSDLIDDDSEDTAHTTSVVDRLKELAFGTPQTSTNAPSVAIHVTSVDATNISGSQPTTPISSGTPSTVIPTATSEQTFVSGDLSWQSGTMGAVATGWQATLFSIRDTLVRILSLLQPFQTRHLFVTEEEENDIFAD